MSLKSRTDLHRVYLRMYQPVSIICLYETLAAYLITRNDLLLLVRWFVKS